jgi:hypothetical protein
MSFGGLDNLAWQFPQLISILWVIFTDKLISVVGLEDRMSFVHLYLPERLEVVREMGIGEISIQVLG